MRASIRRRVSLGQPCTKAETVVIGRITENENRCPAIRHPPRKTLADKQCRNSAPPPVSKNCNRRKTERVVRTFHPREHRVSDQMPALDGHK